MKRSFFKLDFAPIGQRYLLDGNISTLPFTDIIIRSVNIQNDNTITRKLFNFSFGTIAESNNLKVCFCL